MMRRLTKSVLCTFILCSFSYANDSSSFDTKAWEVNSSVVAWGKHGDPVFVQHRLDDDEAISGWSISHCGEQPQRLSKSLKYKNWHEKYVYIANAMFDKDTAIANAFVTNGPVIKYKDISGLSLGVFVFGLLGIGTGTVIDHVIDDNHKAATPLIIGGSIVGALAPIVYYILKDPVSMYSGKDVDWQAYVDDSLPSALLKYDRLYPCK